MNAVIHVLYLRPILMIFFFFFFFLKKTHIVQLYSAILGYSNAHTELDI